MATKLSGVPATHPHSHALRPMFQVIKNMLTNTGPSIIHRGTPLVIGLSWTLCCKSQPFEPGSSASSQATLLSTNLVCISSICL